MSYLDKYSHSDLNKAWRKGRVFALYKISSLGPVGLDAEDLTQEAFFKLESGVRKRNEWRSLGSQVIFIIHSDYSHAKEKYLKNLDFIEKHSDGVVVPFPHLSEKHNASTEEEVADDIWYDSLIVDAKNKPDTLVALLLELFRLDEKGFNDNQSLAELLELKDIQTVINGKRRMKTFLTTRLNQLPSKCGEES